MQINLTDPNPPVKFYFDDEDPKAGHVLLRRVTPAEAQKIRKLCSKKQPPEYRRGTRYEIPDRVNETLLSEKIWDYSIAGWEGLKDENGKNIPCTPDMKIKLMLEVPDFSGFITKAIETLEADPGAGEQELSKNSSSTSQD